MTQVFRKHLFAKCLAVFLALQTISCGTLLYPERRGQPPGYLDVGVVALDAVGLLLFLVPGIVAFAVDFATGTIYLPPERPYLTPASDGRTWQAVRVDPAELTPERLAEVVRERTGQAVRLEPGSYQAARIDRIEDAPATLDNLQSTPASSKVVFRGTSR
jgi:hypothetical protein